MTTIQAVASAAQLSPQEMFEAAHRAAAEAVTKAFMSHGDNGACGIAWVTVKPARGPLVTWCKVQIAKIMAETGLKPIEFGDAGWSGGWVFSNPGQSDAQTIDIHEAGARAFAETLQRFGLDAQVGSRQD